MLKGKLLIEVALKRIKTAKELFLIELEQGNEVFISPDLDINKYSPSFRFYDHILNFVRDNISSERKDFYAVKKVIANVFFENYKRNMFNIGQFEV